MLEWTYDAACRAPTVDAVFIATGDPEVLTFCKKAGVRVIQTYGAHGTGTERVAEAAQHLDHSHIINLQADEPTMPAQLLDAFACACARSAADMVTVVSSQNSPDAYGDRNQVKVVINQLGEALYFSRAGIPFGWQPDSLDDPLFVHVGVYGFRRQRLMDFVNLSPSSLALSEDLEQLRALAAGWRIEVLQTDWVGCGVDTPEDLITAEHVLSQEATLVG